MACVRKRRGKWVIDFRDQTGKRRWLSLPKGSTKKEANERLGEVEKKVRQGIYKPVKHLPYFSEVVHNWLDFKKTKIRDNTYSQYKGHVEHHLKPFFGNAKVNQVNLEAIERFTKHSLEKGVTVATLKKILVNLGAILSYAVKHRYIDFNPGREMEKPKRQTEPREDEEMLVNIFTPDEIRLILDNTASQADRVLFMTAALTGMREGELFGLKWTDFDWRKQQVYVQRTYNHGRFYPPKSKTSKRKIDISPELILELKEWRLACPKGDLDLVFPNSKGKPASAANMLRRKFYPTLRRVGLHKRNFHWLRHTFASLLINQGADIKYIQEKMGHSSAKTTLDIYGHLMKATNTEAPARLWQSIFGTSGSKMVAETKIGVSHVS